MFKLTHLSVAWVSPLAFAFFGRERERERGSGHNKCKTVNVICVDDRNFFFFPSPSFLSPCTIYFYFAQLFFYSVSLSSVPVYLSFCTSLLMKGSKCKRFDLFCLDLSCEVGHEFD